MTSRRPGTLLVYAAATTMAAAVSSGCSQLDLDPTPAPPLAVTAPPLITSHPKITPVPMDAPSPSPEILSAVLQPALDNPELGSLTGHVTDAQTGATLWQQQTETPQVPGSVVKVLTTAAALLTLPAGHRTTTTVVQGATPGQLVLVGGGDPTLTAKPTGTQGYYTDAPHLDDLISQIRSSGVEVSSLVVDNTIFAGPTIASGWDTADIAGGSITPIESIMLDGGRSDPLADYSPRTHTPSLDTGRALAEQLGLNPASVTEGITPSTATPAAPVVASVQSAPLSTRLRDLMVHSDDVLAETVGFEIALARGLPATFDGAVDAITHTLQESGFDTTRAQLRDASGLSTDNRISAHLIDQVLTAAAGPDTPQLRPLLDTLPVAGATGTLADRFNPPSPAAGWVRAKTGSLSGVSSLAGIVVDNDQRVLTFTLMSNGTAPEAARPALDAVATALRSCGCR
ncbi:D-alanyl-D-alanine carboxypeptidase/D-alanyl-D-alanine-endopeptidase [Rhodococcus erythropolis]|uniref:D-alanyl-D-alanine carboxypeptidase/D-alanyl-D-alanine endopeptidase n=1 Tax=Rhodococcus erythropolis TaxID=1833 RepID=UPI003981E0DE